MHSHARRGRLARAAAGPGASASHEPESESSLSGLELEAPGRSRRRPGHLSRARQDDSDSEHGDWQMCRLGHQNLSGSSLAPCRGLGPQRPGAPWAVLSWTPLHATEWPDRADGHWAALAQPQRPAWGYNAGAGQVHWHPMIRVGATRPASLPPPLSDAEHRPAPCLEPPPGPSKNRRSAEIHSHTSPSPSPLHHDAPGRGPFCPSGAGHRRRSVTGRCHWVAS